MDFFVVRGALLPDHCSSLIFPGNGWSRTVSQGQERVLSGNEVLFFLRNVVMMPGKSGNRGLKYPRFTPHGACPGGIVPWQVAKTGTCRIIAVR
jgi:hypothetical protein